MTAGPVVQRVHALLLPPPRQRPVLVVTTLLLTVLAVLAALDVCEDTEHLLQNAFVAWAAP